jgi:hypothetical protein
MSHLFFNCCAARRIQSLICELLLIKLGDDFDLVARFLIVYKKHIITNTVSSAVLIIVSLVITQYLVLSGSYIVGRKEAGAESGWNVEKWLALLKSEIQVEVEKWQSAWKEQHNSLRGYAGRRPGEYGYWIHQVWVDQLLNS